MKIKKIAILLSTVCFASQASNFVTIINKEDSGYEVGGFQKITEYTDWIFDKEDNCSYDKDEQDYYYGVPFTRIETCDQIEKRTKTVKRVYNSGFEEIFIENRRKSNIWSIIKTP